MLQQYTHGVSEFSKELLAELVTAVVGVEVQSHRMQSIQKKLFFSCTASVTARACQLLWHFLVLNLWVKMALQTLFCPRSPRPAPQAGEENHEIALEFCIQTVEQRQFAATRPQEVEGFYNT
jgi:hypothetical protein